MGETPPPVPAEDPRVAILLSTRNGTRFLPEQLESLLGQTRQDWVLYWRDDASDDGSPALVRAFAEKQATGRVIEIAGPAGRVGAMRSFLLLLGAARHHALLAFADQDDVWLKAKLARGAAALEAVPADRPALYSARQVLVDGALRRIGLSLPSGLTRSFPATLTQNLATGNTLMLNAAAARLVAATTAPPATVHDWWCNLVVSAAGGELIVDDEPVVLYRQHGGNMVGSSASWPYRAVAALRRGPGVFMGVFRQHVAALRAHADLLTPAAQAELEVIARGLGGGAADRLAALRIRGLVRRRWLETLLFRYWFLIS
ncbi:MAG TPA: glycosyltransferase [Acetobacteraceae bacterium]|nr:glycosyltransferase [Acetobacteraceae bacterium]